MTFSSQKPCAVNAPAPLAVSTAATIAAAVTTFFTAAAAVTTGYIAAAAVTIGYSAVVTIFISLFCSDLILGTKLLLCCRG
jgi:hypothetical protein